MADIFDKIRGYLEHFLVGTSKMELSKARSGCVLVQHVADQESHLVYWNKEDKTMILRVKFQRINSPVWPATDPYCILTEGYVPARLVTAPIRPIVGWPLDHMETVEIAVKPGQKIYYFGYAPPPTPAIGANGWLFWTATRPSIVNL